jgi:hypothetical protein
MMTIYCHSRRTQPTPYARSGLACALWAALLQLTILDTPSALGAESPTTTSCSELLQIKRAYLHQRLITRGTLPDQTSITLAPGREWLIEAREQGNDALVELLDPTGLVLAQADHPERRTGTRRAIFSPTDIEPLTVRITGKEHAAVSGTVDILVFDLAELSNNSTCRRAYR